MIRDPGRGGTLAKVRGTMIFVLDLGISSVVISGPLGVGPRRTSADLGLGILRNYTRTRILESDYNLRHRQMGVPRDSGRRKVSEAGTIISEDAAINPPPIVQHRLYPPPPIVPHSRPQVELTNDLLQDLNR